MSSKEGFNRLAVNLFEKARTLPKIEWIDLATFYDPRSTVLVTTPSADKQSSPFCHNFNIVERINITGGDAAYIENLQKKRSGAEVMYTVGGGRAIDLARLLAYTWNMDITAVPTIISTDSPFVDCTGVREDGCVHYIKSKKADRVFLDFSLLKKSPGALHAGGAGDVLSIYTALPDWKLASDRQVAKADEPYSIAVADQAQGILDYLMANRSEIHTMSQRGLESLVKALAMEVELCNLYGNSRPEEGGEHFFAYAIEPRLPHTTHGELVGLGILVTSLIQYQKLQPVLEFMNTIGMNYRPKGFTRAILDETLRGMPSYVNRHGLRYSVWNEYCYNKKQVSEILDALNS